MDRSATEVEVIGVLFSMVKDRAEAHIQLKVPFKISPQCFRSQICPAAFFILRQNCARRALLQVFETTTLSVESSFYFFAVGSSRREPSRMSNPAETT